MTRPRVLVAMTVYNGEEHVRSSLASIARLRASTTCADVELLVLDDCSPAPGFSDRLSRACSDSHVDYYRSPLNLGIPRNVNLALLACLRADFDHVIVLNSDVIVPANLVDSMLRATQHPGVGSVTAWSNNVSAFSLLSEDPQRHIANQATVDWISETLHATFGDAVLVVPTGVSFCMLFTRDAIERTGLMDPVFGKGYGEESDWSTRSQAEGLLSVLAPGVFTYHHGHGSTKAAGVLQEGQTTVDLNERIIDMKHPHYHQQVADFLSGDALDVLRQQGREALVRAGVQDCGYVVIVSRVAAFDRARADREVVVTVDPDEQRPARAAYLGYHVEIPVTADDVRAPLEEFFGHPPMAFDPLDSSCFSEQFKDVQNRVTPAYSTRL